MFRRFVEYHLEGAERLVGTAELFVADSEGVFIEFDELVSNSAIGHAADTSVAQRQRFP